MLRRVGPVFSLSLLLLCVALFAATTPVSGHEGEEHPAQPTPPPDDFVLSDAMRLMGMEFSTLRDKAALIDTDTEAQESVIKATENANRYLTIAQLRWAPDRAFKGYAADAQEAWAAARAAAESGDVSATTAAISTVGSACKACHEQYRE